MQVLHCVNLRFIGGNGYIFSLVVQQVQADGDQHGQGEAVHEGKDTGNRAVARTRTAPPTTAGDGHRGFRDCTGDILN